MRIVIFFVLVASVPAWADPMLFLPVGGGNVGYDPTGLWGDALYGQYTSFDMPTITSSIDMPLHPGTTGAVKLGGGLYFAAGPLVGSDATHWYFGNDTGYLGIEDGFDFGNDDNTGPTLFGPDDIPGFYLLDTPVIGSPTVTAFGTNFTLTLNTSGLVFYGCGSCVEVLNAYYGLDPSTQWNGNLTLNFTGVGSPGGEFHNTSGVTGELILTAVPEPAGLLLLGTVVAAFLLSLWRVGVPQAGRRGDQAKHLRDVICSRWMSS
jgi:hypothetical protein